MSDVIIRDGDGLVQGKHIGLNRFGQDVLVEVLTENLKAEIIDECCPGYLGDIGHESCCDFLGKPGGDCCDCDCDGGGGGGGGGGNTCPGPQNGGMGCPVAPGSGLCFGTCTDQGFQQWALGPDCVPRNVMTGAPVNTLPEESCRGPLPGPLPGPNPVPGPGPGPMLCPPGWLPSPAGQGCCDVPWMMIGNQWICPSDTPFPAAPRSAVFGRGSLGHDALGGSVLDDAGVTTSPPSAVGLPTNTVTPAVLTASVNDYAPGTGKIFRLATNDLGAVNITGLSISQVSGQEIILLNIGTIDNIVLKVENASSTAANRFLGANSTSIADITLAPNTGTRFFYDGGASRWRNL